MPQPILNHLLDRDVIENPYPFYQALREHAPVYQVPGIELYLISAPDLIHKVLKNQADYSANLTGILITAQDGKPQMFDLSQFGRVVNAIANADEPFHAVHRKLVLPQLTRQKVDGMEPEIRGWARMRVADLRARGEGDSIAGLANDIPVMVMARLMGLPVEDLDQLLSWAFSGGEILAGTCTLQDMMKLSVSTFEMSDYLQAHFTRARESLTGDPRDVTEELVRGVAAGLISEEAAISIMIVLVGAAGESTSSLVGSVIRVLAQDQTLQLRLRENTDLIENFVEEITRLESPFKGHYRVVLNDTELGGVTLPKGSRAYLLWAAANRCADTFDAPDDVVLDRQSSKDYLGFGHGIHFCIGARLARLEARLIVEELLKGTKAFRISDDHEIKHISSIFVRRLAELHLILE